MKNKKNSKKQCDGFCCTKINNLSVEFNNEKVLQNVNMHIHCGELTAIVGANGTGKSTLLKALLGQIKHDGELKFVNSVGNKNGNPKIGYVPQSLQIDKSTPSSVYDLFAANITKIPIFFKRRKNIAKKVIEQLKITEAEHLVDRQIGKLSGGELQRVLLALALYNAPELLLLDEPISGIDKNGTERFYKIVSKLREEYDLSIILVSHDLNMVYEYADRVIFLDKGNAKIGTPKEIFNTKDFLNVFGLDCIKDMGGEV